MLKIIQQLQDDTLRGKDKQKLFYELQEKVNEKVEAIDNILKRKELESLKKVEVQVSKMPKPKIYMSGIRTIDEKLKGFREGSFNIIAGVNYSGKSQLVLKALSEVAKFNKVVFFSLEMYKVLTVEKLKYLTLTQKENILLDQETTDIDKIVSIIKEQAKKGIKLFAIDSLMKLESSEKEEHQRYTVISHKLSKLSQSLGVIILLIAQTSESDLRSGRLAIKGSGNLMYDADSIMFLTTNKDTKERNLICKKDRWGDGEWGAILPKHETQLGIKVTETTYEDEVKI